ncbi:MAG: 4Fe-4S binding protein, partial [Rhodospirillales bacterium]|nr:4Fe-4S binding protein [Rhodospirillales bacterium]
LWTKRLSGVKYAVLAVLLVLTFVDFEWAAWAAGIEPFKTAITLRFDAPTAAVLWAGGLLILALFVERAFCRFLCPLGAGLAILGRIRVFSFLRRRPECGSPCQACGPVCPTGAIDRSGKINMSECFYCLDCQVLHDDKTRCPPLVAQLKARAARQDTPRPAHAPA